jgi:ABC-type multidrug transport system fused ATPase/permease subunit
MRGRPMTERRAQIGAGAAGVVRATLRRRRALAALAAWALVSALPTFASGQAIARAVDDGFLAGEAVTGVAWLGLLAATVPLGAWGARRTYLGVARVAEPMRDDLVRAVVGGALRRSTAPGAPPDSGAVARLTQHVETVRENLAGLLLLVLSFVAALVAALAGMLALAPVVLPFVVVPLLVSLGAFAASLPGVTRHQRRLLLADEAVASLAGGTAEGLRDVVACGGEDTMAAALGERIDEQVDAGRALARVAALRTVIVAIGGRLPVILVLFSAGWLLRHGLSEGALLGTLTYLIQGLGPAVSSVVGGVGGPLAQLAVTVRRIDDATPPPVPPAAVVDSQCQPADACLALRGVTFRYREAAEPVIDGLDLDIPHGDHLAVVGPSGAGKSTLAALLVGVLRPQEGTAALGGHPAHSVTADTRVLIPQEAYAFRDTLGDNLRYLRPDATEAALDRAVAAVGMAALAERLGGYDAELDPAALSAGERQLVALARAYVSPARLVVLDEATCHLDPTAEAAAEQAFATRGGTLVVVAHRISSALRARRILVMDGCDAAVGTHDDLVDRSPLYRDLVGHWLDPSESESSACVSASPITSAGPWPSRRRPTTRSSTGGGSS